MAPPGGQGQGKGSPRKAKTLRERARCGKGEGDGEGCAQPRHYGTRGEGVRLTAEADAPSPERYTTAPPQATRMRPTQAAARGATTHSKHTADRCVAAGRPSSFALPCRKATMAAAAVVAAAECPTPAAAHAWWRLGRASQPLAHPGQARRRVGERPPPFPVRVQARPQRPGPPRRLRPGRNDSWPPRSLPPERPMPDQRPSPRVRKGPNGQ